MQFSKPRIFLSPEDRQGTSPGIRPSRQPWSDSKKQELFDKKISPLIKAFLDSLKEIEDLSCDDEGKRFTSGRIQKKFREVLVPLCMAKSANAECQFRIDPSYEKVGQALTIKITPQSDIGKIEFGLTIKRTSHKTSMQFFSNCFRMNDNGRPTSISIKDIDQEIHDMAKDILFFDGKDEMSMPSYASQFLRV